MNTKHAVIWIDHQEAKIFFVDASTSEMLHAHKQHYFHGQDRLTGTVP